MLEENLGVTIDYATMDFGTYQDRLATDPPDMWSLSWVADYPGSNDFLGVLLGTGSTSNEGGWSNPDFDAAIADAGARRRRPEDATAAYARALEIVRDEAPAVPVSLRHVVHARPRRAAGRDPERPRHPPPRGARMGTLTVARHARHPAPARDARRRSSRCSRALAAAPVALAGGHHVRRVDGRRHLRRVDRRSRWT